MRKLGLSLAAVLCVTFLASNAFAAGSLYQAGDKFGGIGYQSTTVALPAPTPNITGTGSSIQGGYFFTDNIDLVVSYFFGNYSQGGGGASNSGNTLAGMVDYHMAFSDNIGGFVGVGYSSLTLNNPAPTPNITGTGFTYEVGIESKLTNNIIGDITYRASSQTLTQGAASVNANVSGFGVNINYLF